MCARYCIYFGQAASETHSTSSEVRRNLLLLPFICHLSDVCGTTWTHICSCATDMVEKKKYTFGCIAVYKPDMVGFTLTEEL